MVQGWMVREWSGLDSGGSEGAFFAALFWDALCCAA